MCSGSSGRGIPITEELFMGQTDNPEGRMHQWEAQGVKQQLSLNRIPKIEWGYFVDSELLSLEECKHQGMTTQGRILPGASGTRY